MQGVFCGEAPLSYSTRLFYVQRDGNGQASGSPMPTSTGKRHEGTVRGFTATVQNTGAAGFNAHLCKCNVMQCGAVLFSRVLGRLALQIPVLSETAQTVADCTHC